MSAAIPRLLLLLCLSLPAVSAGSCSAECRPSASCCSESQCTGNGGDPEDPSHLACPCLVSGPSCVAPAAELVLDCDPGGDCLQHCSWDTPLGPCSWTDRTLQCPDSVTPVMSGGNCNIKVSSADYRHSGSWKCKVVPSTHAFSDSVNVTVSSNCPNTSASWWRSGWTAGLLWSGVAIVLLILIILITTLIYCLCPTLCVCLTCCARERSEQYQVTRAPPPDSHRVSQESGVHYSQVSKHRSRRDHFHGPVILEEDRTHRSGYHPDVFETRNVPSPPAAQVVRPRTHQHEAQYEMPGRVDYQVPRIYASSNPQMRTAKKKSNFDSIDLEERIRKASGVARQEHV